MNSDQIQKIWIDKSNRLCIQPLTVNFDFIYRSAMGVQWDATGRFLYPPFVGSWSPVNWFSQIISALQTEYGYHLDITENTEWENIDESVMQSIKMENEKHLGL